MAKKRKLKPYEYYPVAKPTPSGYPKKGERVRRGYGVPRR